MLWRRKSGVRLETPRLELRPPESEDQESWIALRAESRDFLEKWEPLWAHDHLTKRAFRNRVIWAQRLIDEGKGAPLFLHRKADGALVGAITLDNIRRGPAQAATVGYWIGAAHARQGLMTEALGAVRDFAFETLDISRIEAACLPENAPSRALLERVGFKYEGVAQAYLQINGRWRTHVLYAAIRSDRRGKSDAG
jgi:ribosomal-protein-alanine N-acetyltransferase